MQYSDQWRTCRKLVHQFFREEMVVKSHIDLVNAEAVQMLRDFVEQPEGCMRHPKRFSNSIIMSLSKPAQPRPLILRCLCQRLTPSQSTAPARPASRPGTWSSCTRSWRTGPR